LGKGAKDPQRINHDPGADAVLLARSSWGITAPKSEKEVLAAMNAWKQAMLTRDRAALQALRLNPF
jgi:hypothetical protein